jgi:divalent metal cation (Fe/Co/Zn/Cd) transporter
MLAEALHATADTGNELLLLVGMKRSSRPPDEFDPYGHGKALYFYSLLVAVSIFGVGGGLAIPKSPTIPNGTTPFYWSPPSLSRIHGSFRIVSCDRAKIRTRVRGMKSSAVKIRLFHHFSGRLRWIARRSSRVSRYLSGSRVPQPLS